MKEQVIRINRKQNQTFYLKHLIIILITVGSLIQNYIIIILYQFFARYIIFINMRNYYFYVICLISFVIICVFIIFNYADSFFILNYVDYPN